MTVPQLSTDELLDAIRGELVAQRVVLTVLVDNLTLLGGPDRDRFCEQLEALELSPPEGGRDDRAMMHLAGIAQQLRTSGRGRLFRMNGARG